MEEDEVTESTTPQPYVNIMEMIKSESADINIKVYVLSVISLVAMVVYAIYLTYRSEKIKKMLVVGADTIKTLSNLQLNPGSSLATLSNSVRRKTMEKINSRDQRKDDVEYLVTDDLSPDI